MPHLTESGADGIGLFRTELQFMIGETMPRLADQMRLLQVRSSTRRATSRWCSAPSIWAATRCCPMRAGSGRKIRRWAGAPSASRSIVRRLLRYQVRALLMASAGRTLRILLPMVSDVDEFNRGRALIDRELERARLLNLHAADARSWSARCWKCRRWPSCCRS